MAERSKIRPVSPFCALLRTKKVYSNASPAREVADILDGSGRSWCLHTQESTGPDGDLVDPEDCQRSRRCFEVLGPGA